MRHASCLSMMALAASVMLAGSAYSADPPGSTPSAPSPRDQGPREPASAIPLPTPRGPTDIGIGHVLPPPPPLDEVAQPGSDPAAEDDALIDALLGISVPLPPPSDGVPDAFAANGPGVQYLLEDGGCSWTNDNVAVCLVLECDTDEVCVEVGSYCVDHNGNQVPCP